MKEQEALKSTLQQASTTSTQRHTQAMSDKSKRTKTACSTQSSLQKFSSRMVMIKECSSKPTADEIGAECLSPMSSTDNQSDPYNIYSDSNNFVQSRH